MEVEDAQRAGHDLRLAIFPGPVSRERIGWRGYAFARAEALMHINRSLPVLALIALAAPAAAQEHRWTIGTAGHIATEPVRDVGLSKTRIPPVLQRAAAAPYGSAGTSGCAAIKASASTLDDALGPDYGHATTRKGSRTGAIAEVGGTAIVNSLIPFRSVVREVSGAAAAQRRLAAAVQAGYARRGYLHGLSAARGCPPL